MSSIDFSHCGQLLAVGLRHNIAVVQIETGELLHDLNGHECEVCCVKFNPSGSRHCSISIDNNTILWDVKNGTSPGVISRRDFSREIDVAFSCDASTIFFCFRFSFAILACCEG